MHSEKLAIDPAACPPETNYKLLIGSIVPRPIAFVSTLSPEGVRNLAPFSFFNAVCANPPVVTFASGVREPPKDTLANVRATGEFVINIVTEEIAERMNLTSGEYPHGIDEFAISGLTPVPSTLVADLAGLWVNASTPASGASITTPPTTFQLTFSVPVGAAGLHASACFPCISRAATCYSTAGTGGEV